MATSNCELALLCVNQECAQARVLSFQETKQMNYTFSMGNNFFYLQCCPRVVMSCYLLHTPRCGGYDDVRMESQLMMIEWCH